MRLLVVDSNIVFANSVKDFVINNLKNAEVDIASNVPILQLRMRKHDYDFIIADIVAAFDTDALVAELHKVNIPVLIWTMLPATKLGSITQVLRGKFERKPASYEELKTTLTPFVSSAKALESVG